MREETITAASAEIVNEHHKVPFSENHGSSHISSSDAQRFRIRADSLLAAYYPRYYGYYEKAIGIYTHLSDQYSVIAPRPFSVTRGKFFTSFMACWKTTNLGFETSTISSFIGWSEMLITACFLPWWSKTADLDIVEEQWGEMIHVATSLKEHTAPAHLIVKRLINNFPSDRLSKSFTNLVRIIKTEYILHYITDKDLRRTVQLQLNERRIPTQSTSLDILC